MEGGSPITSKVSRAVGNNEAMSYFLGIDGGGSKTTYVLGDDSAVLATVTLGGSNIVRVGEPQARRALQQGIHEVCKAARVKPTQIAAVCAGMAGAAREEVRRQVAAILRRLVRCQVEVVGDMVIAHHAAFGGEPGIVVVAGTGSIAYGRHASGRTARAGGWGFAISDEGSGHWVGVQAVAAVMHALDSGTRTRLSDLILQRWRLDSHDQLARTANASPVPDFAALFPEVLEAADAGDSSARDVLLWAGLELAKLGFVVFRRLWEPEDPIRIALSGGVFVNSRLVRDSFERETRKHVPQAEVFLSQVTSAEGALAMARWAAGGRS